MSAQGVSPREMLAQSSSVQSESSTSSQHAEVLQRLGNIEAAIALLRFPMPEQALTLSQTAKVLQVSVRTVRSIIDRGELRAFAVPLQSGRKLYRISQSALRDFMHQTGSAPPKSKPPSKQGLIQVPDLQL